MIMHWCSEPAPSQAAGPARTAAALALTGTEAAMTAQVGFSKLELRGQRGSPIRLLSICASRERRLGPVAKVSIGERRDWPGEVTVTTESTG